MLDKLMNFAFGTPPQYEAPSTYINEQDINSLIDATRSRGLQSIRNGISQASMNAAEAIGARGMAGTGGIPAQVMGNIQSQGLGAITDLNLGLTQQRMSLLNLLQQQETRNAEMEYQSEWNGFAANRQLLTDIADVGGSFALTKWGI